MIFFLILIFFTPLSLFSRAGGGCLVEGTIINTKNGNLKIEDITPSTTICLDDICSKVADVYRKSSDEIIEITACGKKIESTPEHLFMIEKGVFKEAGYLQNYDYLYTSSQKCRIEKIIRKK